MLTISNSPKTNGCKELRQLFVTNKTKKMFAHPLVLPLIILAQCPTNYGRVSKTYLHKTCCITRLLK